MIFELSADGTHLTRWERERMEQKPCKIKWCVALAQAGKDYCVCHQGEGKPIYQENE